MKAAVQAVELMMGWTNAKNETSIVNVKWLRTKPKEKELPGQTTGISVRSLSMQLIRVRLMIGWLTERAAAAALLLSVNTVHIHKMKYCRLFFMPPKVAQVI